MDFEIREQLTYNLGWLQLDYVYSAIIHNLPGYRWVFSYKI